MQARIAFISYHTCPLSDHETKEIGGMNTYVLELSKQLAKQGFMIDIFTRSQDKDTPSIVSVLKNLRVIHLPAGEQTKIPKKKMSAYIPEFVENFNQFVHKENIRYQLISAHYYLSGIIGVQLKQKYTIPLFMTFHTLGIMKNLVARSDEEQEDLSRIKSELEIVKEADKIIATSQLDAQYIETLYNGEHKKISVLWPGVNLEQYKPMNKLQAKKNVSADTNAKLILFVGRLEPLKGLDVLLYAVKIMLEKDSHLNLCLWIVGGDTSEAKSFWSDELKKLEELRRLLEITTAVQFISKKEREELIDYYNAADIVVMPSQYESFGLSALEAMACGTPVITTDVTGVSEVLDRKHAHLVTSANNPMLLAAKMHQLLANESEYQRISHEVYENVQDLSWGHVAEKFIRILKKYCTVN